MSSSRLLPLLLLGAACQAAPSPPPPTYVAEPIGDTLMAPVVNVAHAVAQPDQQWALLGIEEGTVLRADFGAGTVARYPGITADEVPGAAMLFGNADTIYVGDWALQRVTAWTRDGRRVDAIPTPDALHGAFPRARDAAGQWYFSLAAPAGPDGMGVRDSGAVVRADPYLTRFDTLVRLAPPEVVEVNRGGRMRLETRALTGHDRWGVLPDGTLWLARNNQNQVFWYPPKGGAPIHTEPLPDPILPISEMDRQIYIRRYPEANRPDAAIVPFALVKPPFERAFAPGDGRVWLFDSAPALDSVRTFQVADSTGWVLSISVASYGVALDVTRDEILMGEENPEGVRLLRFRIPEQAKVR